MKLLSRKWEVVVEINECFMGHIFLPCFKNIGVSENVMTLWRGQDNIFRFLTERGRGWMHRHLGWHLCVHRVAPRWYYFIDRHVQSVITYSLLFNLCRGHVYYAKGCTLTFCYTVTLYLLLHFIYTYGTYFYVAYPVATNGIVTVSWQRDLPV